jgi:subtilase family serine protease
MRFSLRRAAQRLAAVGAAGLAALAPIGSSPAISTLSAIPRPLVSDFEFLAGSETPPTEAQCASRGRRCFDPLAIQRSYDLTSLYAANHDGAGQTIVVVDSFGSSTMRNDLRVFNNAFGLKHMCGEQNADGTARACAAGAPTFDILQVQGSPPPVPPPANNGTGQENHNLWSVEVALDVEWAHSIAPGANILLVTTPTAETLGVQGFVQMMNAEQFVIDHHLGSVITQSFGSAEEAFGSTESLLKLRHAFESALTNNVTVFASSGDTGTANIMKQPVKTPTVIPFPTVIWPASDPLVTAVGGTSLCTNIASLSDPTRGTTVDTASFPRECRAANNPGAQREVTWNNFPTRARPIATGGGPSHVFSRPDYQTGTVTASARTIPDVALVADPYTGVLVYDTEPAVAGGSPGGTRCPAGGPPCSAGWYVVGGTSASSPQWAGMIAIANQMNGGHALGFINPSLYKIGRSSHYAADFFDVTSGTNQVDPAISGFSAGAGWDPVTGWGTPRASHLIPDLITLANGGHLS